MDTGHEELGKAFSEASHQIDTSTHQLRDTTSSTKELPPSTAPFHLTYHPNGLQNVDIQRSFKKYSNFGTGSDRAGI